MEVQIQYFLTISTIFKNKKICSRRIKFALAISFFMYIFNEIILSRITRRMLRQI